MKIALVHDQLQEFGGAERVLVSFKKIFPEADVITSFYNPGKLGHQGKVTENWHIITSWADKIPLLKKLYSPLRFITPKIWESFDLSNYNIVISSSGSYMCKGVITKPNTVHICYLHHPPRYLYGYETAIEWQKHKLIKIYGHFINHFLRMWDYTSSQRPKFFIANSEETQKRIRKFYHRDSVVIYPPVSIPNNYQANGYQPSELEGKPKTNGYYLTVSRLARAKHIDVLIKAANKYQFNLKIVGAGRDEKYLKSLAGQTIDFLGSVNDKKMPEIYQNAKAFLFSAVDEEFGIAPVEAMGYGLPVIAYKSGGLTETVKENINGFLFNELSPESLIVKIKLIESLPKEKLTEMSINSRKISEQFSEEIFERKIREYVDNCLKRSK